MKERQILPRIALTRALYDQMAPQLCPFYVPGKLSFSSLVFIFIFSAFLMSGRHLPEERKTPIGPIHIVFLLGPTQTSFSFSPAGTPEATSWEQEQMARPHNIFCSRSRKLIVNTNSADSARFNAVSANSVPLVSHSCASVSH